MCCCNISKKQMCNTVRHPHDSTPALVKLKSNPPPPLERLAAVKSRQTFLDTFSSCLHRFVPVVLKQQAPPTSTGSAYSSKHLKKLFLEPGSVILTGPPPPEGLLSFCWKKDTEVRGQSDGPISFSQINWL